MTRFLLNEELRKQTIDECLEQLKEVRLMLQDLKRITDRTGPNSGRRFSKLHRAKISNALMGNKNAKTKKQSSAH